MGTMLQGSPTTLDDFDGHEGCNEILNVTRPDIVRVIHDAYLEAGVDCVKTNTFGANLGNLGEYGIADRIDELARGRRAHRPGGRRRVVTGERPRWVLGSMGPGTKLPTLGHVTFAELRDTYQVNAAGLLRGGADALIVETCQDLLQAKAAIIGARRAIAAARPAGADIMLIAQVTVETTGTMLLGSEIGAALTALEPLGIDVIGLNCATGPAEMSEHLRYLAAHSRLPLSCMPNAGLPELTADGAYYPVTPDQLADAHEAFAAEFGLALVGGCCGTTPEHMAEVARRLRDRPLAARRPQPEPGVASLYQHVPFRQDTAFLAIGERTNANGSKAFREAMLAERYDDCVEIARAQTRDGAHLLDVCVDYVGRDGASDMRAGRRAARHGLDAAARARLHRARGDRGRPGAARRPRGGQLGQLRGRRRPGLAVRPGHAAGPRARRRGDRADHRRAGPGPHRRLEGGRGRPADRGPDRQLGHAAERHHRRLPHVPDRHRPGGDPAGRHRDDRGDPRAEAPLPGGADDARRLQRLLRPEPGGPGRAQLGVPRRVRAGRAGLGDRARLADPADLADPRGAAAGRARPGLRPAAGGLRPADPAARAVRGRRRRRGQGQPGRRAGRAAAVGAAEAPDHRRREERPRGRPGRGAGQHGPRWRSSTTSCWTA